MWFPQLGQSMLNKINKVCVGKKAQKKNCKRTSLFPPLAGAAETADESSSSHVVCVTVTFCSGSEDTQQTRATTGGGWAQREGIPRAGPLGRLRGSIRQTFVIDGHGTPACEERASCRDGRWDMGCGPPAHLCARAQQ